MNASFGADYSGHDASSDDWLQSPHLVQDSLNNDALTDPTAMQEHWQQDSSQFDSLSSSLPDVQSVSSDGYGSSKFLETETLSPVAPTSLELQSDPLYFQDSFQQVNVQNNALLAPHNELQFGISMDAGQTDSGDNVVWSTAENAGGAYYNERTGEQVEPK